MLEQTRLIFGYPVQTKFLLLGALLAVIVFGMNGLLIFGLACYLGSTEAVNSRFQHNRFASTTNSAHSFAASSSRSSSSSNSSSSPSSNRTQSVHYRNSNSPLDRNPRLVGGNTLDQSSGSSHQATQNQRPAEGVLGAL